MISNRSPVLCLTFALIGSAGAAPRDAVHLNAIPQFAGGVEQVRWDGLPKLAAEHSTVFAPQENVAGYNMHPSLAYFGGRWWAMWSSGAWGEDMPGQKVRYASSADGVHWDAARVLAEPDPGFMLTPTGFWVRDGELLAMACHRRGKPVVDGKRQKIEGPLDYTLRIFRHEPKTGTWAPFARLPDTFNDKPVEHLSSGEWAMIRVNEQDQRYFAHGGTQSVTAWNYALIPPAADGHRMTESHLYELADGGLTLLFRDNDKSRRIYRAFSENHGRTWTAPVPTDFPDEAAKFSVLHLNAGGYVLVSNPRPIEDRFPLCVSLSRDGLVFDRIMVLVGPQAGPVYPNFTKHHGAQYPHALEHDGQVLVIYSLNQESIEVAKIPANRLQR